MLRAALASQQHWRAECHGSTVALPPPCLPQTLPTDGSDSLLPAAGMGAWPHLDGPAVRRGSGCPPPPAAAPDGEPPQLPLFASGFQHGLGIFLLPFAGACPPRLLTLRCDCILSTPARLLPVAAEWGGVGGELLLRRKPKSPKLGVSVTGSDVVGRRELKYFGFTCNTRTPCSPGVVAYEINILRRFSSTI